MENDEAIYLPFFLFNTFAALTGRYFVNYLLLQVVGLAAAVLLLVLFLPLVSLLTVPKWLLTPLLLPLAPSLVAIPLGFVAFNVTRSDRRWRLIGVTVLQALAALSMAVLAGWQVFLWFSPRVEADFAALINESLLDPKWHTAFAEVRCPSLLLHRDFKSKSLRTPATSRVGSRPGARVWRACLPEPRRALWLTDLLCLRSSAAAARRGPRPSTAPPAFRRPAASGRLPLERPPAPGPATARSCTRRAAWPPPRPASAPCSGTARRCTAARRS